MRDVAGSIKASQPGSLAKERANGKQVNWDPIMMHDKNYFGKQKEELIQRKKKKIMVDMDRNTHQDSVES